jgi:thioredoxin 1
VNKVKVEVVTSGIQGCASCERATKLVKRVLEENQGVEFGEINALEQPERIEKLGMVTSGAIVIDGELAFSSLPSEKAFRQRMLKG